MDYNQWLTFQTVAKLKHFSKSADLLNVTQPTVTARIQSLENDLHCKLFYRTGKQLTLTEDGEKLLPFAEKIIQLTNSAIQTVGGPSKTKIQIGISPAFSVSFVTAVLSVLQSVHPISISVVEGDSSSEIGQRVIDGELDVGLVRSISPFPPVLVTRYIKDDKLALFVHKDHPLAKKDVISTSDLRGHKYITYLRNVLLTQKIEDRLLDLQLDLMEVGNVEVVKSMVDKGLGFTIIPNLTNIEDFPNLCAKPLIETENITCDVLGVYREDSVKKKDIELILEMMVQVLQDYGEPAQV